MDLRSHFLGWMQLFWKQRCPGFDGEVGAGARRECGEELLDVEEWFHGPMDGRQEGGKTDLKICVLLPSKAPWFAQVQV